MKRAWPGAQNQEGTRRSRESYSGECNQIVGPSPQVSLVFSTMILKSIYFLSISLAVTVFCVSLFAGSEEIRSECLIPTVTPTGLLKQASVIFEGEVISASYFPAGMLCEGSELKEVIVNGYGSSYEFRVNTVWKGSVNETEFVSGGGVCGGYYAVGETYLVFAHRWNGSLHPLWQGFVTLPTLEEHLKVLGEGWIPERGSSAATPTPYPTPPTCPTATNTSAPTHTLTPTATISPVPTPTPTIPPVSTLAATDTPVPTPTPTIPLVSTLAATDTSIPTPSPPAGTCDVLGQTAKAPLDTSPVVLLAGITWLGFRRLWRG